MSSNQVCVKNLLGFLFQAQERSQVEQVKENKVVIIKSYLLYHLRKIKTHLSASKRRISMIASSIVLH
jgi:hypothetical protein